METPDRRPNSAPPTAEKTDLEVFLRVKAPELFEKHAANILMVVLLVIAAGFFLYTRSRNKAAEQAATNQNTAIAYDFAQQAREMFNAPVFSDAAAHERQQKVRDVFNAVELVLTSDADASQKAAAQLAKADVLWQLANAPDAAIATTQPASGFTVKNAAGYLDDAEQAYTEILSKYADQKEYAANALLSLAAIAETRGKFDDAKQWYEKVIADATLRPAYHDLATSREKLLVDLRKPYAIAPPTSQPTTDVTTAAQSATQPMVQPGVPATTKPATPPSILNFAPTVPTTSPAGM